MGCKKIGTRTELLYMAGRKVTQELESQRSQTHLMPGHSLKVGRVSWEKDEWEEFKCLLPAEFHLTCWNLADMRQPRRSQKEVLLVFLMKYFHFKGMINCERLCVKSSAKFLLFVNLYDWSWFLSENDICYSSY